MEKDLKSSITIFGSLVTSIFSLIFVPLILLCISNFSDYISGIISAYCRGDKITPKKGILGIWKKIAMWLIVIVAMVLDMLIRYSAEFAGIDLKVNFLVSSIVCIWLVCNELLSILRNVASTGLTMPKFLEPLVQALLDKSEDY